MLTGECNRRDQVNISMMLLRASARQRINRRDCYA
jgi:hypothetical protein